MISQIDRKDFILSSEFCADRMPIIRRSEQAVKNHDRRACSVGSEVQFHLVSFRKVGSSRNSNHEIQNKLENLEFRFRAHWYFAGVLTFSSSPENFCGTFSFSATNRLASSCKDNSPFSICLLTSSRAEVGRTKGKPTFDCFAMN